MKKIAILMITLMLISVVFLCGCNENGNFEDTNNVELVEYKVESYKFGNDIGDPNIVLGEGFNYKEGMVGYKVYGALKNNEGEPLSKIKVIGNFYDGNTFLGSDEMIYNNIPDGETRYFNVFFHNSDFPDDYLLIVDNVQIKFKIQRVSI